MKRVSTRAVSVEKPRTRRRLSRPMGPGKLVFDSNIARKNADAHKTVFEVLKQRLRIRNSSNENLARLKKAWKGDVAKTRLLNKLISFKKNYQVSLRNHARIKRIARLRIVRDPKFVQIENATAFAENVFRLLKRCEANKAGYSMATLDLDKFKGINDGFGHDAGDVVIDRLATFLSNFARENGGAAARVGGEEFRVFVPMSSNLLKAELEKMNAVFSSSLSNPEKFGVSPLKSWRNWTAPTFSAGVSGKNGKKRSGLKTVFSSLVTQSDKALYASKKAGRKKVSVA